MRRALPEPLLCRLSDFLAIHLGLSFPQERWDDLERGISAAAREFRFADAESCVLWLLSGTPTRNQVEVLASHLSVGETYFFREKASLEALEQHILPELLRTRVDSGRYLRIWSAGCCTGEEAYSIAMILDRVIPDAKAWNVSLLATDINPNFLRKAAQGVYGEWSFRDVPSWIRERHFKKKRDGRFELQPRLRKKVVFSYLNLADDVYPSLTNGTNAMDVIFCRNVLMYFTPERTRAAAARFYRALADGGWLIVSPAETSHALFSAFSAIEFSGAVLYRKSGGADGPSVAAEWRPPLSAAEPRAPFMRLPGTSPERIAPQAMETASAEGPQPDRVAAEQVNEAWPGRGDADALPRMARICANQGRLADAIEWCEKAIAADKLNPAHHYLLAVIRQEQGQAEAAVRSLERALYLDPGCGLAHFALGNLRLSQARHREAKRHFTNALELLAKHTQDEVIAGSGGVTAGRLVEIVASVLSGLP